MKPIGLLLFFILSATAHSVAGSPADAGKTIFSSRCAGCHNVNKVVTGPALGGIDDRRSIEWIVRFVHSSQTVIKGGDLYAVALYEKFNRIPMPDHPDLTADDIKGIVEYIKSSALASPAKEPLAFRPEKFHPAYLPLSIHNYLFIGAYLGLICLLVVALIALVRVKEFQRRMGKKD